MRFPSLRACFFCIVCATVFLASSVSATVPLENAYRWLSVTNKGAYSAIVTGNPTLRDNVNGKWSYMRVVGQKIISGNVYYIEIGWLKGSQSQSNGTPRVYWAWRDTNGIPMEGWALIPELGLGTTMRLKRT